jgi:hypothetical protein
MGLTRAKGRLSRDIGGFRLKGRTVPLIHRDNRSAEYAWLGTILVHYGIFRRFGTIGMMQKYKDQNE